MYLPPKFRLDDESQIAEIIDANSFATLVTHGADGLCASHLPFEWDEERRVLTGHMARANAQWRDFGGQAMVIFQGPHAYVSPRAYDTELAVPTWNYVAVHAYGVPHEVDDARLQDLLTRLVARHEAQFAKPWTLDAPGDWQASLRRAVVGFEMRVTRLEAKAKLSQNRSEADQRGVIADLAARGHNDVASWMRRGENA